MYFFKSTKNQTKQIIYGWNLGHTWCLAGFGDIWKLWKKSNGETEVGVSSLVLL